MVAGARPSWHRRPPAERRSSAHAGQRQDAALYFEGNVDVTAHTMTVTTRTPMGPIQTEAQLPYGFSAGNVFFHTCAGTLSWAPPTYTGTVQAVNLMSGTVMGMTAVIDSVTPSTVTFATPIATYGDVATNTKSDCGTRSACSSTIAC